MPAPNAQQDDQHDDNAPAADEFEAAFAAAHSERPAQPAAQADTPSTGNAPGSTDAQPGQAGAADPNPEQRQDPPSELEQLRAECRRLDHELAQALHRERSVAGRISASDQRSAKLQARVTELEQQLQRQSAAGPRDLDDVLAESPELEQAIQRRIDNATRELQARLDAAAPSAQADHQPAAAQQPQVDPAEHQATKADTMAKLDQAHPLWRQHAGSSAFAQWLNRQRQQVQDAFANAYDFPTASAVLQAFYAAHPAAAQQNERAKLARDQNTERAAASSGTPSRVAQAAGLAPRSVTPAGRAQGQQPAADDYEAAFAAASAARRTRS